MNTPAQESSSETRRQENDGITQDDIRVVRSLLRMFPMWGTLIVVPLTSAVGSTFYIEQFSYLRGNDKIPAQMFDMIQDLSGFAILILYSRLTCVRQNEKLKIGVGMLCSIISCVFAWILEFYRLKEVREVGDDENTSISFLWLVSQFCILGFMEGLTEEGSLRVFKSQIDELIKSYREEYMEVVMCLGKLVNIFLILILDSQLRWFGDDVNNTHLDRYYLLLVCLCSVNFVIYCCIAKCFYEGTEPDPHSAKDNLQLRESTHATNG
ncbi:hypothetical protein Lser_V15G42914 [Lactuca serriola]